MAARGKDMPAVIDFESSEWDTKDGDGQEKQEVCAGMVEAVLTCAEEHITNTTFSRRVLEQTVDSTIEAALSTVDTLFVARENEVAVSTTSLMHSNWEPEPEPVPCGVDTWLRAAIPESTTSKDSFLMTQFLRTTGPAQASARAAHPDNQTRRGMSDSQPSGSSPSPPPDTPTQPLGKTGKAGRSRSSSPSLNIEKALTPEQAAAEDRLREELEIRKAQLAVAAGLDAKDAETKARLTVLARSLKGKDYSYDHQGRIVPMSAFNADDSRQLHSGADFRLQSPDTGHPKHSMALGKTGKKLAGGKQQGAGRAQASKPPVERKLVNDFREAPSRSQPNAMESMNVNSGVTLRQGSQAKSGPQRPHTVMGMTREEFMRYAKERSRTSSPPVMSSARPTQPIHFPPITTASAPTAPNTGHGTRAARGVAHTLSTLRLQQGLGETSQGGSSSQEGPGQQQPSQPLPPQQPLQLPRLSSLKGSSSAAAQAAAAAAAAVEAGAEEGPVEGGRPVRETSTTRFELIHSRGESTHLRLGDSRRTTGAAESMGVSSSVAGDGERNGPASQLRSPARPSSSPHGTAHPLSAYPDSPSRTHIAKPKTPHQQPLKPPTPDANPYLVSAADWGTSTGSGRQQSSAALTASKPDLKAWEAEVGRTVRLPRDRASQATIASPMSPLKMAAVQQERPRSMTFAA